MFHWYTGLHDKQLTVARLIVGKHWPIGPLSPIWYAVSNGVGDKQQADEGKALYYSQITGPTI